MRLVAYTVLLAGTFADQRSDLRALRSAYTALDRMRVNEAERATLEERARLAREIHDGLAQHLWFAKLKFERLSSTLSRGGPAARRRGHPGPRRGHHRGPRGAGHDALQPGGGRALLGHAGAHRGRLRDQLRACGRSSRPRPASPPPSRRACRSSCCASSARPSTTCASTPTPPSCASPPRSTTASCSSPSPTTAAASTRAEAFDKGMGLQGMRERAAAHRRLPAGEVRALRRHRPSRCARRSSPPPWAACGRDQRAHGHGPRASRASRSSRADLGETLAGAPSGARPPDVKPTGMQT